MILPGQELRIPPKLREQLGVEISDYVDDLESTYSTYFQDIATWWKWYEATPAIKGQKNFPFVGASNVVIPLIQIMVDAHVNRFYAAVFRSATEIWTLRTEREDLIRQVGDLGRFLNWTAQGNDYNLRLPAYDNLLESAVIGSSVLALNWRDDRRWAYAPARGKPEKGKPRKLKVVQVRHGRGAFPEHVPREQILWDTNFLIQDAPIVVREFHWSWSKLRGMSDLDSSWHSSIIENIRGQGELRGPSQIVQREKDAVDSRTEGYFGISDIHDIREVHIDWPLLGAMGFTQDKVPKPGKEAINIPSPPIVATIDRNSKQIIRLIAEPYFFPDKPFYDIYYRKRSGRGHSVGISSKIEGLQRGITASYNQSIDARTRANAVWAKTSRREMLDKPINPAQPIYDPTMQSFQEFNLHPSVFDDQRMMTVTNTIAERLTGQSDPAMGRDTRQGGHPSPARSTIALMQQSDLMQGTGKELMRLQYSRLGEGILSLYQQFETDEDGKLKRILGDKDAARVEQFVFPEEPVSSSIEFDVLALSNQNNPQEEIQKALLVSQMNQNYWLQLIQAMRLLPQADQITKEVILRAIKSGTNAHLRFLEAADIDDLERYVFPLADEETATRGELDQAVGRAEEIARSRGAPQQPGLGNVGPGNGNGAIPPPRAGGRLQ